MPAELLLSAAASRFTFDRPGIIGRVSGTPTIH
jgi:hypothetical protein